MDFTRSKTGVAEFNLLPSHVAHAWESFRYGHRVDGHTVLTSPCAKLSCVVHKQTTQPNPGPGNVAHATPAGAGGQDGRAVGFEGFKDRLHC